MVRVSSGVAALLCGLILVVVVACSGRSQRSGATAGSGGTAGPPESNPAGGVMASESPGGRPGVAGEDAAAGQVHGMGGFGEGGVGEGVGGSDDMPPAGPSFWWACPLEAWGDGQCDCGCGIRDIDCKQGGVDECEVCNGPGSCSGAACPGRIKAEDNRHCDPRPLTWHCSERSYGDEESCDCGCGAPDPDCADTTPASCDSCKLPGSCAQDRSDGCSTAIAPADNSSCYVPENWDCYLKYGDGICDCGCGVLDVDCASSSPAVCQDCSQGCAGSACPGEISPTDNAVCTPPPAGWRCAEHRYLDGHFCDCGCGVVDPDCATSAAESCEWCNDEGSCSVQTCPGTIAPSDNATCYQPAPPTWWTCPAAAYADGTQCDCGCGAYDLDCPHSAPSACDECGECGPCPDSISPLSNSHCL
jgi:hypothetical protein